ncbi:MAG: hypothetical protein QF506_02180 [Candidatus Woesearchaeota archaeon]|nr:hypothetical protein [Candidatus Woesearchaeota archaeon]
MKIEPNKKKLLLFNLSKTFVILLFITGSTMAFKFAGILNIFAETFDSFGLEISADKILFGIILTAVVATIVMLAFKYITITSKKYMFYDNKLDANGKEISYKNILKINLNKSGIENKILKTGSMSIELTGMEENKVTIDYVENIDQVSNYFQNMLRNFKTRLYSQVSTQQRIGKTLDKL